MTSGRLLVCAIVLTCWSIVSQRITWMFAVMPVCVLYLAASPFQNWGVLSGLYPAITTLIDLTLPPPPPEPEPLAGGTFFAPLPLLHAASASASAPTPASSAVVRLFIPFPPAVSRLDRDAVMGPRSAIRYCCCVIVGRTNHT